MNRSVFCVFLAIIGVALLRPAWATSIITVGDHELLPNRAGQKVQVFVSGGDLVEGENLYIQIADGGAFAGGTATGPVITGVNIITGTIFAASNTGGRANADGPLFWEATTTSQPGAAIATDGLLATITLDTTGFFAGAFPLSFNPDNPIGPGKISSEFAAATVIPVVINDGLVSIVNGWRSPLNPLDVNADTLVNSLDVLQIVNELNAHGTRALEQIIAPMGPPPYYDVSNDTLISPLDALQVTNYINANPLQPLQQSISSPSMQMLSAAAAVPEPSSFALLASLMVVLLTRRIRR